MTFSYRALYMFYEPGSVVTDAELDNAAQASSSAALEARVPSRL